ncbi:MAG: hypothetical protein IPO31_11765 [Candidatus Obscuribacter sp.]|nr:hypothetical protein [Candidatus Obscuribacter sp.]
MSFENRELAADLKQSQGDASQALFADSIGQSPFKMAKQEAKPVLLAWNDGTTNDGGMPPLEPHSGGGTYEPHNPPPVEQPTNNYNPTNNQNQEQLSQQQQEQINKQNQEFNGRVDGNIQGTVKSDIDNNVGVNTKIGVDASSQNKIGVDASSQNKIGVQTGDVTSGSAANNSGGNSNNVYSSKSYLNSRGEALPGNDCQTFAVRADGYMLGTGGGVGLSNSSNKCIEAKAEKVTCDAPAALGAANEHNSRAMQSWLPYANEGQRAQIVEHGMRNAQHISDNVASKSDACVSGVAPEQQPQPVAERVIVQPQPNLATKQDVKDAEDRSTMRTNRAFNHSLIK